MRHCSSCKHRHMDIKALKYCGVVVDRCELTGKLVLTPFFEGFMCKRYRKEGSSTTYAHDRRRALVDGLLIAASVVALIIVVLVAVRVYAWPQWIKFVDWLPIPGQLKMWLWGWF